MALVCLEVDEEETGEALEVGEWIEDLVEEGEVDHLVPQDLSWSQWEEEVVVEDVVALARWTRVTIARSAGRDPTKSWRLVLLGAEETGQKRQTGLMLAKGGWSSVLCLARQSHPTSIGCK